MINEEGSNRSQSEGSEFQLEEAESGSDWESKNKVVVVLWLVRKLCCDVGGVMWVV